ncbi:MAG: hypothetical protein ACU836_01585 [Gammaproteobacteria bacterium]
MRKFLADMEQVVPWSLLLGKLESHYPRRVTGIDSQIGLQHSTGK